MKAQHTKTSTKLIYWGVPAFAVPALRVLASLDLVVAVVTTPDKPRGRKHSVLDPSPVKATAIDLGLPVIEATDLKDPAFLKQIRSYGPATFMIVAFGAILPASLLEESELPPLNIHPSLLPLYRGPSPIQSALLHGESQTALTLMQIDEEMDHGPIIAQKKIAIQPEDTYVSLSEKLSIASTQFVERHVPKYLAGIAKITPQDHARATVCGLLKRKDGVLDFSKPALDLHNAVRALNPWPGTFFMWNDKRIKVLRTAVVSDSATKKRFSQNKNRNLEIRCGEGALEILRMQVEGRAPMASVDFLRGHADLLRAS